MPNPASTVSFYQTALQDTDPQSGATTHVTIASKMVACLSDVAPVNPVIRGSPPDNSATWWPWFKARHQISGFGTFWVQGHLLNDNVYGPGRPFNLAPISNTLNTNMLNLVEKEVKTRVGNGDYVEYRVQAHWDQTPAKTREICGLRGQGGSLLWGEQFAPTRLSWTLHKLVLDPHTQQYLSTPLQHGSAWYDDTSQWMNHFPT